MIGPRAQAGLLFVEADSEFTFSGDPRWAKVCGSRGRKILGGRSHLTRKRPHAPWVPDAPVEKQSAMEAAEVLHEYRR